MKRVKIIWNKWQKLLKKIVFYQSKFLLTFIYFVFISPIAIIFKFFSDSLNLKGRSHWLKRAEDKPEIEQLRNQ